jgi:hypothetical protein
MLANVTALTINPLFLRHHLLIELGRLDLAIDAARHAPANENLELADLETRRSTISDTLLRLTA